MKISIITVCFNSDATIRDTIESVLSQNYSNIEYIVIDGLSVDNTLSIINEYQGKISRIVSEKDDGIYDAMNKGIRLATGDYVGILNSDDVFSSDNVISSLVHLLQINDVDAAYGDLTVVKRNDTSAFVRSYSSSRFRKWKIRFGIMLPHPTFYARRELFEKYGFYKLSYRVAADFELLARFMSKNISLTRLGIVMVKMRDGGISSTGFWWRVHQNFEIVRACRENGMYTNIFLVAMKLPVKLLSYVAK